MSLFCSHHDTQHDLDGVSRRQAIVASWPMLTQRLRALTRLAIGRAFAACRIIHQGIVDAKTRRLEREPALHEIPRCPIILGDEWDF